MPDIIDSFILELGIDPAGVEKGRKEAASSMASLLFGSSTASKKVESDYKKISDGFEHVGRKALGYISLLLGGITITSMVKDIVQTDKAIGILSDTTGVSVAELSKWRYAFERMGGTAEGITGIIKGLSQEMNAMAVGGSADASSLVSVLNALNYYGVNIKPRDEAGRWKPATDVLLEIADALPKLNASRENIVGILRKLPGMDDASLAAIMRGGTELRKYLREQESIAKTSNENRTAADNLNSSWRRLQQTAEQLGRTILTDLAPYLKTVLDFSSEFLQKVPVYQNGGGAAGTWEGWFRFFKGETASPLVGVNPRAHESVANQSNDATPPSAASSPTTPSTGSGSVAPPPDLLARAEILLKGGGSTGDLEKFMASQGYPKSGNWCGEFAAAVVKAAGGTPPKGAAIASNWRPWGSPVDAPAAGDVAVRRGAPTGATGSHVGFVTKVYPDGSFDMLGGNQGRAIVHHPAGTYDFRRGTSSFDGKAAPLPFTAVPGVTGALSAGNIVNNTRTTTKTDISTVNVHTQAQDPAAIAADIQKALQSGGVSGSAAN